ncbi:hypothetical protein BTJ49_14975 [Oleiagrimonas sp. MCCC 1A03011]|nr:hypothetical protein BTJ49_14975 [Oleiagrimonas sp. MCCC 1A03011]
MRNYVDDPKELAQSYALAEMLQSNNALRENIQLALTPLQDDSHAEIVDFLFGEPPEQVRHPLPLVLWSLCSLSTLAAVIVSALSVWMLLGIIAVNGLVILRISWMRSHENEALKGCLGLLQVADALVDIGRGVATFDVMQQLRQERHLRKRARASFRWISLLQLEFVKYAETWLNIVFLFEQIVYMLTVKQFTKERGTLQSTFELLGSIDAAVAIASSLECFPDHCKPAILDKQRIDIKNGYHPLLSNPVSNTLSLDGRSALITGSNMAGKTTMIKMVGTNIILGRTLGFCLASQASIPRSGVMASIRSEHSVESGKSHYFSEIETLRSFIQYAREQRSGIFIIDELFSGTNTVERIAIARAVLEKLSIDAMVMVTTHDVELQQTLSERFDLYHFQENPDVDGFFDYKLIVGAATERNAIRLLDRIGFPGEVVARAMDYVLNSIQDANTKIGEEARGS